MVEVRIYWYLLHDISKIGIRKEGTRQIFCFKKDGTLGTNPDLYNATEIILGTYNGGGSTTLQKLAEKWMKEFDMREQHALVKTVAFGNHLKAERRYNFEWDEYSLDILQARVERLPLEKKRAQRKKDYEKRESALDIAKIEGRDVKVISEEVKNMKDSIERLDLVIRKETIKIEKYEERYYEVHNGEHSTHRKKSKAVKINNSKGQR